MKANLNLFALLSGFFCLPWAGWAQTQLIDSASPVSFDLRASTTVDLPDQVTPNGETVQQAQIVTRRIDNTVILSELAEGGVIPGTEGRSLVYVHPGDLNLAEGLYVQGPGQAVRLDDFSLLNFANVTESTEEFRARLDSEGGVIRDRSSFEAIVRGELRLFGAFVMDLTGHMRGSFETVEETLDGEAQTLTTQGPVDLVVLGTFEGGETVFDENSTSGTGIVTGQIRVGGEPLAEAGEIDSPVEATPGLAPEQVTPTPPDPIEPATDPLEPFISPVDPRSFAPGRITPVTPQAIGRPTPVAPDLQSDQTGTAPGSANPLISPQDPNRQRVVPIP